MKKITKIGLSLMTLSAFVFAPVTSYAELKVNLTGSVKEDINSTTDVRPDSSTGTKTSINADTSVGTDITIDLENDSEKDEKMESNATTLKVNTSGIAVVSSAQVSSESDLTIFSENASVNNKKIADVDADSNSNGESEVKVVYRHSGKFLGFIPVTIKSTTVVEANVDAEAEVHSRLSWWSFLVANENYVKADIESRIKNNATVKTHAKVDASAQARAQIAEAIIAEVSAHANAQVSVDK
jgi:hypothetical protein